MRLFKKRSIDETVGNSEERHGTVLSWNNSGVITVRDDKLTKPVILRLRDLEGYKGQTPDELGIDFGSGVVYRHDGPRPRLKRIDSFPMALTMMYGSGS